jgi:basic membrane protein A and related proteins
MKKGLIVLLILLIVTPVLFAGGKQEAEKSDQLKIAAMLPGPINDGGWNTLMYNSLMHQKEVFGADVAYTEQTPAADYEEIFRGYADAGYDVIFGHGFEFGDVAKKVAPDYPDTTFIINSTNISQNPNLGSFLVYDFQAGFVQGVVAAIVTNTGVVGFVGGMEIPPIVNQGKGFVAGAKYINPDIDAKYLLTGSFYDIAKAKEMTRSLIAQGADIVVADSDEGNHGIIEAAEEGGALVIGCSGDLYETVPEARDVVLTSVTEDMPEGHELVIRDIIEGRFVPKNYLIGFAEDAVHLAPFRDKESLLSAEQKAKINEVVKALRDGSLDVSKYY